MLSSGAVFFHPPISSMRTFNAFGQEDIDDGSLNAQPPNECDIVTLSFKIVGIAPPLGLWNCSQYLLGGICCYVLGIGHCTRHINGDATKVITCIRCASSCTGFRCREGAICRRLNRSLLMCESHKESKACLLANLHHHSTRRLNA